MAVFRVQLNGNNGESDHISNSGSPSMRRDAGDQVFRIGYRENTLDCLWAPYSRRLAGWGETWGTTGAELC